MKITTAKKIIKPIKAGIFRTIFLYTGQGESTLMVIPTGPNVSDYKYVLIDCDEDREKNEIDIVKMLKDLFQDEGKLSVFINTHPHKDHLAGIKNIYDEIGIDEVWHSNHKPSGKDNDAYNELKYVLKKVSKSNEYHLKGTNDNNTVRTIDDYKTVKQLGGIDYQVLSPAEHICDEIDDEDYETRRRRIHEQCGVIKFSYKDKHILITGDSDKKAWQETITKYYEDVLPSDVLSASHHGSRTFFKNGEDDKDVFEEHIETISPTYLIISAPKQEDSDHDHPHDDAMELYKKHIEKDNIFHMGNEDGEPYCVIVDIDDSGNLSVNFDKELIDEYGYNNEETDKNESSGELKKSSVYGSFGIGTKVDDKPMGEA